MFVDDPVDEIPEWRGAPLRTLAFRGNDVAVVSRLFYPGHGLQSIQR